MEDSLRNFLMALPLTMMVGGAWAQDSATVTDNCANHLNTSPNPTVGATLNCLAEMQRTISRLEAAASVPAALSPSHIAAIAQELKDNHLDAIKGSTGDSGKPGSDAQFPSGAVVAFDLPNGCPTGWQADISAAAGRVIVGVDGKKYRLPYVAGEPDYQLGGSETHTLTKNELPPHAHNVEWVTSQGNHSVSLNKKRGEVADDNQYRLTWASEAGQANRNLTATEEGAGNSFEVMPPYIALYFCKKE